MAIAVDEQPVESGDALDFDAALNEVAGHLNAQHARLVDLTITMLADESLWVGEGNHTPELFLAWRTGLAANRAHQVVAIARRATELPDCVDAFRRGELAIDQMAAIANRAPWWTDNEICDLAKFLTVGQLRRTLAKYPFPDIPSPDDASGPADPGPTADEPDNARSGDAEAASAPHRMWWGIGDDGVFRLHAECDPLDGMIIEAAINEARDALFQRGVTDVTDIDALVEMAQRSLATVESPARRDRFRTNIHLRTDGTACDAHGWNLPDAIRQYINCDGLLSPVFVDGAIPISVGRTQRMVPQRTRLLVLLRDQGCTVPGCNETHHLGVHHIVHWENGGPTDTWNLIALCPRHHRMHHRGELGITGNADTPRRVTYTNRHGRPLGSTGAKPEPPGAAPPTPDGVYEHPLGERLDERWLYFNPHPNTANGPGTNTRATPFAPADPAARLHDHPTAGEPGSRSVLDVDHDRGVARSGAGDGRQVDDPPSGSKVEGQGHDHRFALSGQDRDRAGRLAGVDRPKAYLDLGVDRRQERRARRSRQRLVAPGERGVALTVAG